MARRAFGSGRSALPVIGTASRSLSALHSAGSDAWAICFAWGCSSDFCRSPPPGASCRPLCASQACFSRPYEPAAPMRSPLAEVGPTLRYGRHASRRSYFPSVALVTCRRAACTGRSASQAIGMACRFSCSGQGIAEPDAWAIAACASGCSSCRLLTPRHCRVDRSLCYKVAHFGRGPAFILLLARHS
jgi:hypothetical protein